MDIMEKIFAQAAENPQRVCFSEATEEKILLACKECVEKHLIVPVLVGVPSDIKEAAEKYGVSLEGMDLVDSTNEEVLTALINKYNEGGCNVLSLSEKGLRRRAAADPMNVAMMLTAVGDADASFAGLTHTTGDVIMAGTNFVGLKDGISTPSSVGIFRIPGYEGTEGELIGFGDSAVCVNPTSEELASIAASGCETLHNLLGWDVRCALLSYSTDGSASSDLTEKVRKAVEICHEKHPELKVDGEFQLDSAINPAIAAKKVKRESEVAGKANLIIWPDINCGNVGVKLVQNFAKADAYGPLLQGFRKVVCDCSRGAPVSELVGNIAMCAVRAQRNEA